MVGVVTARQLDTAVRQCKACYLCKNKPVIPYWTDRTKYAMIFPVPYKDNENMVEMWEIFKEYGYSKKDFLLISTVQCPTDLNRQKRFINPAKTHRNTCRRFLSGYLSALNIQNVIAFGNVSMEECIGEFDGITKKTGTYRAKIEDHIISNCTVALSPYSNWTRKDDNKLLRQTIEEFKRMTVE